MEKKVSHTDQEKERMKPRHRPEDFRICFVDESQHERYMDFFKDHFLTREQLCVGSHINPDEFMEFYRGYCKTWMYGGLSTYAIYTPTNELAGIMLNQIVMRSVPYIFVQEDLAKYSEKTQNIIKILCLLENSTNIFADSDVNKFMQIAATSVHSKFSGNRLVYRMAEVSEKRAIELGCQVALSQSTNIITQHIRMKMGYKECFSLDYASLELDGKKALDCSVMNGSKEAKVLKKYLKEE